MQRPGYSRKSKELEKSAAAAAAAAMNNSTINNASINNKEGGEEGLPVRNSQNNVDSGGNNACATAITIWGGDGRMMTNSPFVSSTRHDQAMLAMALSRGAISKEALVPKKPLTYADIIQRLVSRFIHETKKTMKMDGVNEDDLLEIKQDISSLR